MHGIHCLNNISSKGTDLLTSGYELVEELPLASGVLVRSAAMHDMDFPKDLFAIARAGAGVNNIPLDRCAEEGIVVFNTPGANANAVKELVLCALLLGSRDIAGGIAWCRENADDQNIAKAAEKAKKAFAGREIMGKKLGVVGLGAIGALVANAAIDLGMDVYGYDPYVSVGAAWRLDPAVHHVQDLDDIMQTCDYITIHVPAMESTKGMIDEHACALMHDGTVFVNFSRDTLVDNAAMAAALEEGRAKAYITDFAVPAVMQMPNAIVLPHLGASTAEAEENCAVMATRQIMQFIETGNIVNSVNYPAITLGACKPGSARVVVLASEEVDASAVLDALKNAGATPTAQASAVKAGNVVLLADVDAGSAEAAVDAASAIAGVRRARVAS